MCDGESDTNDRALTQARFSCSAFTASVLTFGRTHTHSITHAFCILYSRIGKYLGHATDLPRQSSESQWHSDHLEQEVQQLFARQLEKLPHTG
jgi:hypothetical protein